DSLLHTLVLIRVHALFLIQALLAIDAARLRYASTDNGLAGLVWTCELVAARRHAPVQRRGAGMHPRRRADGWCSRPEGRCGADGRRRMPDGSSGRASATSTTSSSAPVLSVGAGRDH